MVRLRLGLEPQRVLRPPEEAAHRCPEECPSSDTQRRGLGSQMPRGALPLPAKKKAG